MNSKKGSQENSILNQETLDRLKNFAEKNQDILKKTSGLTQHILIKHLAEACKYNKGYYKNNKGEYIYVKGIEVTNDTSNLLRMGFNGEDNGVWIHISEVDEKHVSYRDVPIFVFTGKFDPRFTSKDELMCPTTKEDFEQAVQRAVENINADYPESVEPKEYLDVVTEWGKMLQEALFDDMFVTIDEFPAE